MFLLGVMCQTIFRVGAVTSGAIEWRNKIPHDGSKHECTCGPYLPPILALEAACIGKANMGHLWSQQARFYGPPLPAHHSPMWGPHGYAGQVGGGSKMATGQDQSTWQINCWASVIYKYGTNITAALKSQFILNLKSLTVGCKACHKNPHCNVGVRLARQTCVCGTEGGRDWRPCVRTLQWSHPPQPPVQFSRRLGFIRFCISDLLIICSEGALWQNLSRSPPSAISHVPDLSLTHTHTHLHGCVVASLVGGM